MRIAGIIAEYNPFHQGHAYHIEETRRQTSADCVIVLMSGSHVQRGEPAVYDKYCRTEMALRGGADVVFEMPAAFSSASAREFASYGVSFFAKLGADLISFGSECGRIEDFMQAASLLNRAEQDSSFDDRMRAFLKDGLSYPEARMHALLEESFIEKSAICDSSNDNFIDVVHLRETLSNLLSSPNNLLGLEYVSAYLRLKDAGVIERDIDFFTLPRVGMGYHDTTEAVSEPERMYFPSATKRRKEIFADYKLHPDAEPVPVFPEDYASLLHYCLLRKESGFDDILDINDALRQKLLKLTPDKRSYEEVIAALKSKDLTYTRVSRALLHLILGIRESDFREFQKNGYAGYGRILGFQKKSSYVLRELHRISSIPLVTKLADMDLISDQLSRKMLEQEILASHIYQNIQAEKSGTFKNEFRQGPVML